jgi:chromate transporter
VTVLAFIYGKYKNMALLQGTLGSLRPAVVSMIAKAGFTILISSFFLSGTISFALNNISLRMIAYFVVALFLLRKIKMNPILVMMLCGVAEVIVTLFV